MMSSIFYLLLCHLFIFCWGVYSHLSPILKNWVIGKSSEESEIHSYLQAEFYRCCRRHETPESCWRDFISHSIASCLYQVFLPWEPSSAGWHSDLGVSGLPMLGVTVEESYSELPANLPDLCPEDPLSSVHLPEWTCPPLEEGELCLLRLFAVQTTLKGGPEQEAASMLVYRTRET